MADGQVVFEIKGDPSGINQTVKQVTSNIQSESRKWDQATGQATGGMEQSFASMVGKVSGMLAAAGIGSILLNWGKAAVEAASDLSEVQNVVDTVFGDGANQIESWAKKAGAQFGLTETQAKKFTSTLGAMMKSSGLAGNEIVDMSTDLAGLAADMASFYNMDFETAFEKIRSGISGETMPLKQLGINMSVANLEAFALAQGLEKTFSQMSQGEQTMLRYQYLMQATADAQGDFERTSDGFANAQRRIQTALDTISTVAGTFILNTINPLVTGIASFLEKITATKEETLFDQVAAIDVDKEAKLKEINEVADAAQGLIDKLTLITDTSAGESIGKMAVGANKLSAGTPNNWKALFGSLKNIDGLQNIFGAESAAGQNIEDLANALSNSEVSEEKAKAWQTFLSALSDNAEAVSTLTGTSVEETAAWLSSLSDAVNSIDPNDAQAWDDLLTTLVKGFSSDTPEGQKFMQGLAEQFLAMGSQSDIASEGLKALGFTSDQITDKQEEWLKVCKELVQTIPGLSSVINTETGEVKGGIGALNDYVEEWKASQEKLIYWKAYYAKVAAQQETQDALYSMEIQAGGAKMAIQRQMERLDQLRNELGIGGEGYEMVIKTNATGGQGILTAAERQWNDEILKLGQLRNAAATAEDKYTQAVEQNSAVIEQNANEHDYLVERFGEVTEGEINAANAADDLSEAIAGVPEAAKAMQAVADYYNEVYKATRQAVDATLKGFSEAGKAGDELREKQKTIGEEAAEAELKYSAIFAKWGGSDFKALQRMADSWDDLTDAEKEAYNALTKIRNEQKEVNDSLDQYKPEGMIKNLQSQIEFMNEYLDNLNQLKEWGVSEQMIASLSDGSKESAEFLHGLAEGGPDAAKAVGELYDEVQQKKEGFSKALTENKLTADEAFQSLVDAAEEAMEGLDFGEKAKSSMSDSVQGIVDGIAEKIPAVQAQVSALLEALAPLDGLGFSFGFTDGSFSLKLNGKHETGLDFVPFDGYLAELHEGEGILTAEENRIWQRFKNGQSSNMNVDYDALGGVMRDNVKAGGNVYLDGRTVGHVVSDIQGNQYRSLQRSGWQG